MSIPPTHWLGWLLCQLGARLTKTSLQLPSIIIPWY